VYDFVVVYGSHDAPAKVGLSEIIISVIPLVVSDAASERVTSRLAVVASPKFTDMVPVGFSVSSIIESVAVSETFRTVSRSLM
jgi:hypothetical protein